MSNGKQYIEVTLLSGRSYIGYVLDDFSPNYADEICFTLHNVHFFYPKVDKKGETTLALISIQNTPEETFPDMDIMWQAVATIRYLRDDSKIIKEIEANHNTRTNRKEKAELYILSREKKE